MPSQPGAIVGAGLAGLLAAQAWPTIAIFEAAAEPRPQHRALLRFRSDAVSRLTGIEFTPVLVRKGIWSEGRFRQPNIALANQYAEKTLGRLEGDRSIWHIEPVTRYIAPEDFYEQLIEMHKVKICWGIEYEFSTTKFPVISTAPLPHVLKKIIGHRPKEEFLRAPITVSRYRIPNCRLYQTIYFPDPELLTYRASISGDLLIVESIGGPHGLTEGCDDLAAIAIAFGLRQIDNVTLLETVNQRFGKIVPLPDAVRKHLLYRLTNERQIYSLGRFATWRNILLDDVVSDIDVIKRLLRSGNPYDVTRASA